MKARIRAAAEDEDRSFYVGAAGDAWRAAPEPIGTGIDKPHLTGAPWLIVVFAERFGLTEDGTRQKNYSVPESVGLATGVLITALHHAGPCCLAHTPNHMKFHGEICGRPDPEKPVMILPVGWPAEDAAVPEAAMHKKPRARVITVFR